MKRFLCAFALVLLSSVVLAENFEDFLDAVEKENVTKSMYLIKEGSAPIVKITAIPDGLAEKITNVSYRPECIDIKKLSLLTIIHWDFDGRLRVGQMIVNKKIAQECADIFTELFNDRYQIEKIKLIDEYNASDDDSMLDNNSSALCCRIKTGQENEENPIWSKHSYGTAIDINPVQNPYVKPEKDLILPPNGEDYVDRTVVKKGMIIEGDPCYTAFVKRGWIWGGDWDPDDEKGRVDWQHFEKEII